MLKVDGISCGYAEREIIEELNLAVHSGEFISIIGPNGSGKTTLFRAISGVIPLLSGEISLKERQVTSYSRRELARIMAVVPQSTNISFSFVVEDIVMMGRTPYLSGLQWESASDVEIMREKMALTGVEHLSKRYINELSGGEAQRVIIARALTQEPELILLDEPTAFLDINHQVEIYDLLKKLNVEENLTIMTISHDLNLAALYSDRLILLKDGRIFKEGRPAEVLTEQNLKEVYETEVIIEPHPLNKTPRVLVKSRYYQEKREIKPLKIHLIGGGGSISDLLRRLYLMGHQLSVGVLNQGDSDHDTAQALGIDLVEEKPFSPIEDKNHQLNLEKVEKSDLVILACTAFGSGNKLNLEAAYQAACLGRKVFVVAIKGEYDFINGEAATIRQQIISMGGVLLDNQAQLFKYLDEMQAANVN